MQFYIGSLMSEFISGDFKENKLKVDAFTDNKPVEQSIRLTKQGRFGTGIETVGRGGSSRCEMDTNRVSVSG